MVVMKKVRRVVAYILVIAILLTGHIPVSASSYMLYAKSPAQKSIVVTKVNASVASKLHAYLIKGYSVSLKVSNKGAANKIISSLQEKIKSVNKQGIIFQYEKAKNEKKYAVYTVSKDNAKLYKYSIAFIQKLYSNFKNNKAVYGDHWYNYGVGASGNWTEYRFYHELYDHYLKSGSSANFYDYVSKPTKEYQEIYDQIRTYEKELDKYAGMPDEYLGLNSKIKELRRKRDALEEKYYWLNMNVVYELFEDGVLEQARMYGLIFSSKSFSELSDAMKVWMIAASGYFSYKTDRLQNTVAYDAYAGEWVDSPRQESCFGMIYDSSIGLFQSSSGWRGMKLLLNNKAYGVCDTYVSYERILFAQLDIEAKRNHNDEINHAWTVVKVKNRHGKILWIPFDYGIGPAKDLLVSDSARKKYLRIEAMRYRTYLSGIKGAPSKKNFTQSDFI